MRDTGAQNRYQYHGAGERKSPGNVRLASLLEIYCGKGKRVLVVEDDECQREVLSQMLDILGYNVSHVAGGHEAMAMVKKDYFDLLVLDYNLQEGWDGVRLFQKIVMIRPHIKGILVTGCASPFVLQEARRAGISLCLAKPYSFETLARVVNNALSNNARGE